jgi:hypothetical protein
MLGALSLPALSCVSLVVWQRGGCAVITAAAGNAGKALTRMRAACTSCHRVNRYQSICACCTNMFGVSEQHLA